MNYQKKRMKEKMTESGWKPVIWKEKTPKPIRRSDGTVLKGPPPEQPKPLLKIREEPQGELVVDTDERQTVRHVMRVGSEESVKVKSWEEKKQEVLSELNRNIGHQYNDDQLDDCIKVDVDVREV